LFILKMCPYNFILLFINSCQHSLAQIPWMIICLFISTC
jgi:hypothetical protein